MIPECFYIFMGQLPQQAVKVADSPWGSYFNRDIITAQIRTIMTFAMSHFDTLKCIESRCNDFLPQEKLF